MKQMLELRREGTQLAVHKLIFHWWGIHPTDGAFEARTEELFSEFPEMGIAYCEASGQPLEATRWHRVCLARDKQERPIAAGVKAIRKTSGQMIEEMRWKNG